MSQDLCFAKPICTEDDLGSQISNCINGKRNVTYYWKNPLYCDVNAVGSYSLPGNTTIDCPICKLGQYIKKNPLNGEEICDYCMLGL